MDSINWPLVWGFIVTWLAFGALQTIPRAIRSVYIWTSKALFGSLTGSRRMIATTFAGACFFWVIVVAGAIYSPLTLWAPRVLPFPGGIVRAIILIELWLLVLAIPLIMGAAEFYFTKGSFLYRLTFFPRAFVHVIAIALAMAVLLPWIVWRFVTRLLRRLREEQVRLDIDHEKYDSVTQALVASLRASGLKADPTDLPRPVRWSRKLIVRLGPPMLRPKGDYEARQIIGEGFSLIVFDGLITALATREVTSRVRLGVLGRMPPDGLWLTQSEGARELEKLIRTEGAPLDDIPQRIAEVDATLEEWRVLSWEYTQVLVHRATQERDGNGAGAPPAAPQHEAPPAAASVSGTLPSHGNSGAAQPGADA